MKVHVVVVMAANLTAPETTYNWSWIPWGIPPSPPLEPPSPPEGRGVGSRPAWERAWLYIQDFLPQDSLGGDQAENASSPSGEHQSTGSRAHWFSSFGSISSCGSIPGSCTAARCAPRWDTLPGGHTGWPSQSCAWFACSSRC